MAKKLVAVGYVLLVGSMVAACATTSPSAPDPRTISGTAASALPSQPTPAAAEEITPTTTLGTADNGSPDSGAGITGVTVVDVCPVMRNPPCPDKPVAARVSVLDATGGSVVATAESGTDGHFSIAMNPGQYLLRAVGIGAGAARPIGPLAVTIEADRYTTVKVRLDSGIR
jgi:hypothetical protein